MRDYVSSLDYKYSQNILNGEKNWPATPLFKKLETEGRILTRDWSKYNRKTVVFEPKNMSIEDLQNGFVKVSNNFNSISNLIRRDFRSLKLGFYPFLATGGRILESYMNRRRMRL